jgi:hypothetical protein
MHLTGWTDVSISAPPHHADAATGSGVPGKSAAFDVGEQQRQVIIKDGFFCLCTGEARE